LAGPKTRGGAPRLAARWRDHALAPPGQCRENLSCPCIFMIPLNRLSNAGAARVSQPRSPRTRMWSSTSRSWTRRRTSALLMSGSSPPWGEGVQTPSRRKSFLIGRSECHARFQRLDVPTGNEGRQHSLVAAGRDAKKIDQRYLVLERLTKPPVVGYVRVVPHEGIVDRLLALGYLAMYFALVVVPRCQENRSAVSGSRTPREATGCRLRPGRAP
jgi:hypothetical protein